MTTASPDYEEEEIVQIHEDGRVTTPTRAVEKPTLMRDSQGEY